MKSDWTKKEPKYKILFKTFSFLSDIFNRTFYTQHTSTTTIPITLILNKKPKEPNTWKTHKQKKPTTNRCTIILHRKKSLVLIHCKGDYVFFPALLNRSTYVFKKHISHLTFFLAIFFGITSACVISRTFLIYNSTQNKKLKVKGKQLSSHFPKNVM